MSRSLPTFIGTVQSVTGGTVTIELRNDLVSTLVLVQGESHRLGQIGSFLRIPLGYSSLFGMVTQVGAAATPPHYGEENLDSHRWVTLTLFGESVSGQFERGISQYPTVGDDVHVITRDLLETIYRSIRTDTSIDVGVLSSSSGIAGTLDLDRMVSRHLAVVGSTGAGKSNLVSVLLDSISTQGFPSARVIVIDPHGEYGTAVGDNGYVFGVVAAPQPLVVPYWALPAEEFISVALGPLSQGAETAVRDAILELRRDSASRLPNPPPDAVITADSPIPFSARRLWFELDDYERQTLQNRTTGELANLLDEGDPQSLRPNRYPPPSTGNVAPFVGARRGITRQLELMRSRLSDARYQFLFEPGSELTPNLAGDTTSDLDRLVASWIGHDRPITVFDTSGLPQEVMSLTAGTMLRIVYDSLFWAGDLAISGRQQPLLVVIDEAHRIFPATGESPAKRLAAQIAKEGRKYGVGLMVVTQRPSEIDETVLSQCGTMIALRLSNARDRGIVAGTMPDDLGNLTAMLPALRTGEGLVTGEAMPIPSRIRFRLSPRKPVGSDPHIVEAWKKAARPDPALYAEAVVNWRKQTR
ncbi:ATP-binding protein [Synechococcus sp. CS-1332]|uniref:ATP-binding protein n=1 Tax=Synechococcus sp. CS-1332 TaxID=2847972 RepID=UPI00223C4F06|nr:ATP-binding protein [Synechococcus sp. CS-1332]MCT0206497.1 ATP-binding protein [Synechococcus sp. CS-1332]